MPLFWLMGVYLVSVARAFCPPGCSCNDTTTPTARCVGGGITVIPLLFNPGLRRLSLERNAIRSLDQSLVFLDQLEELDVSRNQLATVGVGNFGAQARLRELRLAHNNVSTLSPGAFRGLSTLDSLDLSHNALDDLPLGALDDLPRLTVLRLGHNRLHALAPTSLSGVRSLLLLDLCDNFFRDVPTAALEDLLGLRELLLCRNRLTSLEAHAFPTDALLSLSLEANSISDIEAEAFLRLTRLRTLDLGFNLLPRVPTDALSPLSALEALSLNRNRLEALENNAFRGLAHLHTLEISRNHPLARVESQALSECSRVRTLTISNSPNLRRLPEGLLSSLDALRHLDLRANALEGLKETDVPWKSLSTLDLRDNPLVCNCTLRWLAHAVSAANSSLNAYDLQCAHPEKLRGLYLSRLVPSEQLCGESVQVLLAILGVGGVVVLGCVVALLLCSYCRRQRRQKLSSNWPPDPHTPPWSPQTRPLGEEDFPYQSPVTKV